MEIYFHSHHLAFFSISLNLSKSAFCIPPFFECSSYGREPTYLQVTPAEGSKELALLCPSEGKHNKFGQTGFSFVLKYNAVNILLPLTTLGELISAGESPVSSKEVVPFLSLRFLLSPIY